MKLEVILRCLKEGRRFLEVADAARVRLEKDKRTDTCCAGTIETAACRRASMDLTRALAELRRL